MVKNMSGIEGSLVTTGGIGSAILAAVYLLIRLLTEKMDTLSSKMDTNNALLQAIVRKNEMEAIVEQMFEKRERDALRGVKVSG